LKAKVLGRSGSFSLRSYEFIAFSSGLVKLSTVMADYMLYWTGKQPNFGLGTRESLIVKDYSNG
jgi:hypothetical protein